MTIVLSVIAWLALGLFTLCAHIAAARAEADSEAGYVFHMETEFNERTHWIVIFGGFVAFYLFVFDIVVNHGLAGLLQIRLAWPPSSVRWFA